MQFSKQSNYYAKYRPSYPEEVFQELMRHVHTSKAVWDCGTGNGQAAIKLSDLFQQIYATDISGEQLSCATERPNITYSKCPAENSELEGESVDAVIIAQAIHWFDLDAFYEEVRRVVKPGGVIGVIGYNRIQIRPEISQPLMDFFDKVFGMYFSANRKLVEEGYKTIPFPFEEIGYFTYEYKMQWSLDDLNGYLHSWSAVQRYMDDKSVDPTIEIIDQLSDLWVGKEEVSFPIFMRLGRI